MIIFQIVEFMASFVEALLGISLNSITLDGQRQFRLRDNLIASFIIALIIWTMNQFWIFSIVTTVIGVMGIVLSSHFLYKTTIIDSIALTAGYLILVYIVDFFSLSLFGVMVNNTNIANQITDLSYNRVAYLMFDKLILLTLYFFLEKKCLTKINLPMRKVGIAIILAGVQIYILIRTTYNHIDFNTVFIWSFFLMLILTIIYLAIQIMTYIQNNDRMNMALERNVLLATSYKKAVQQYRNEQIFYHDMKNHFLVFENFINSKEYDKAANYVKSWNFTEAKAPKWRTGIDVLDILLEYKKKEAEKLNINVEIICDNIELRLSEQEMVALFGNLLDNAVEACSKIQEDVRWIRIAIRRRQNMTFIKVSNTYKDQPIFNDNKFVSIKSDNRLHGLGMTSMRIIVEKYDGSMEVDYSCEQFTVMISFFN